MGGKLRGAGWGHPHRVGRKTALKLGVEYTVGEKWGEGFTVHAGAAKPPLEVVGEGGRRTL